MRTTQQTETQKQATRHARRFFHTETPRARAAVALLRAADARQMARKHPANPDVRAAAIACAHEQTATAAWIRRGWL